MRILFITGSPPYPLNIGGNQLAAQRLRALSRLGEVDLFLALDEGDLPPAHLDEIRRNYRLVGLTAPALRGERGVFRILRPAAPAWVDRVADYLANRIRDYEPDPRLAAAIRRVMSSHVYDLVFGGGLPLAMKTGISPDFPFVLDVNDTEQEWFKSQVDSPCSSVVARVVAARRYSQLDRKIPELYRRFRHCGVIKPRDVEWPGLEHAKWLGIAFREPPEGLPPLAPSPPASRLLLMLGSYYHRPNLEGLDWFVRRVWPTVRTQVPEAEFRIIGPGLSVERTAAYGRMLGIRVLGTVPSVAPHYQECACTIAPIWSGAGINIKILESYAYGRACVVTPFAFRGYDQCLVDPESVRVGEETAAFAKACADLLSHAALRDQLAAAGQPRIQECFGFERVARAVAALVKATSPASA
ncbi:MAG: glycosyltransferase [Akkermansiaceae bacterium]|nr:glycosyltransferase [Akkermansiaceae bacterium]